MWTPTSSASVRTRAAALGGQLGQQRSARSASLLGGQPHRQPGIAEAGGPVQRRLAAAADEDRWRRRHAPAPAPAT